MVVTFLISLVVSILEGTLLFLVGRILVRNRELLRYVGIQSDDPALEHSPAVSSDGEPESYEDVYISEAVRDNNPLTRPHIASLISGIGRVIMVLAIVKILYSLVSTITGIALLNN